MGEGWFLVGFVRERMFDHQAISWALFMTNKKIAAETTGEGKLCSDQAEKISPIGILDAFEVLTINHHHFFFSSFLLVKKYAIYEGILV